MRCTHCWLFSRTGFVNPVKPVKHARQIVCGNTPARVADGVVDSVAGGLVSPGNPAAG